MPFHWDQRWTSSHGILDYCTAEGMKIDTLATTPSGHPISVIEVAKGMDPPILLAAGSHADEVAGVFAALQLARTLRNARHSVYVVPLRDPHGWDGFQAGLEALGATAPVHSFEDARHALAEGRVLWDEPDFVIAELSGEIFAAVEDQIWPSTAIARHRLPALMASQPELRQSLSGRRLTLPGNVGHPDLGRDSYSFGGHTAYIAEDGFTAHFNRYFDRPTAPMEVETMRRLIETLRPGLTIDLHEGFSDKFYVFCRDQREERALGQAMTMAVLGKGGDLATTADLAPTWGPETTRGITEFAPGLFSHLERDNTELATFSGFAGQFGPSLTTEPGMAAPVSLRTERIVAGTLGAIRAWEESQQ